MQKWEGGITFGWQIRKMGVIVYEIAQNPGNFNILLFLFSLRFAFFFFFFYF